MEMISLDEIKIISGEKGFGLVIIEKDYLITKLLFLLKDIKGIYFKGGTAINKIFLNHARISEDIDFTLTKSLREVEKEIRKKIKGTIFKEIKKDKDVDGFKRIILPYNLFGEPGKIFIDLNKRAKLLQKPRRYPIVHFYNQNIPPFDFPCLNEEEIFAEKLKATIQRNKPRDYIDLYNLIKKGYKINLELTKDKFKLEDKKFDIALIFKNTKKVFSIWNKDLEIITKEEISFQKVILYLADYFRFVRG